MPICKPIKQTRALLSGFSHAIRFPRFNDPSPSYEAMRKLRFLLSVAFTLLTPLSLASAQQGYEFEVYNTRLTTPGTTELELNANFVASGRKQIQNGLFPTHHMLRSSLEIGRGLTEWLEASVYMLGVHQPNLGSSYVGNRVRVTAAAPASWNLPVEFGLTQEIGYARPGFAESRWTYEISPMIGKTWGPVSFVLNPVFERSLAGAPSHPVEFEPKARIGYGFGNEGSIALEYFSTLGPMSGFDPRSEQNHQLFAAFGKELSRNWELALSVGRGLTSSSDRGVIATRLEYRIGH